MNDIIVSDVQQSDSVIHTHVCITVLYIHMYV